jgi:hypothetical protein
MAQDAPSRTPVQFTALTGSATAWPPGPSSGQELIASGSRPWKRARDAQGKFSTPIDPARLGDTAATWFSNPREGDLPKRGKGVLERIRKEDSQTEAAPYMAVAGSAWPWGNVRGQPTAPVAPFTLTMPSRSPHTGHPMAHQDSIASGSQSGGQQTEEERFKSQLVNGGFSIAIRGTSIAEVASDIQDKFGMPTHTIKSWFDASSTDGLSDRGRGRLDRSATSNLRGLGLKEAQFLQLCKAFKDGIPVKTALSLMGRSDICSKTVGTWFTRSTDDNLTTRGRTVRNTIRGNENKTKGG